MAAYVRAWTVALVGVGVLFLLASSAPTDTAEPTEGLEEDLETAESFKFAKKVKKWLWPYIFYPFFLGPWGPWG